MIATASTKKNDNTTKAKSGGFRSNRAKPADPHGLLALETSSSGTIVGPRLRFSVHIDKAMWTKWGFQYPVTYIFRVEGVSPQWQVRWRDQLDNAWKPLLKRTENDFFNGLEVVRFASLLGKAYVSVGFHASNTIEIQFSGVDKAAFESIAGYYDNRQAAYTLSNDNWGCNSWANPGARWRGPNEDESDCYQASLHVCRSFHLPLSIAINSRAAGGEAMWKLMQEELDLSDKSWEPAVHGWTHPKDREAYLVNGYQQEILGCRADILQRLHNLPYGQCLVGLTRTFGMGVKPTKKYVFEHILTHGYEDETIQETDDGEFLLVRGFNWRDNPKSTDYAAWNGKHRFYGIGGLSTKGYDTLLARRSPKGRYYASDVAELNEAFDTVYQAGGIFYALWHPDQFKNSVLYDPAPGIDGVEGSTLMEHLAHVANRKDVWYVANGWLYSYRYVAEHAHIVAVT